MYMNLTKHKIRFVDSLSFITAPLKDFSKIFGLDTSKFSKGYFPHNFTQDEKDLCYEGIIPDKKYFGHQVNDKDFDKWYSSFNNKNYNILQESELYCKQDVIVLKQGCMVFRNIILKLTGYRIDPWRTITIAGLSQLVYRLFDMPERSIAVLEDNYIKHSNEEIEWIDLRIQKLYIIEMTFVILYSTINTKATSFFYPKMLSVFHTKIEETLSAPTLTNIAIASYTTAYARLKLLKALDILGDKVIYMDTDSIVFVDELDSNNQWKSGILTGFSLGDFTDELGNDTYITEFVSTGPKSYAYKTNNGKKECCKVKGFRLKNAFHISFESIKEMVLNEEKRKEKIDVKPLQFKISKYYDIITSNEVKQFGFTFDKREIDFENMNEYEINTIPFGYLKP